MHSDTAALPERFTPRAARAEPKGGGEVWPCLDDMAKPPVSGSLRGRRIAKLRARIASALEQAGAARTSVASRSAAPPTRLETRTKESNTRASHWADETQGRSESKGLLVGLRGDPLKGRSPGALRRPRIVQSSKSSRVGTRKMVNYAWIGRSRGKPRWRSVVALTCKSLVKAGYRGERLIELSSSWFPPKFPSG